ncbi:hypothetical protein ACFXKF_27220 [Streptomyces scopuliridis]|uniref:hypothetical protein n=1 Tax=Streptomyces scopuliridis TaxID=452529 RepID=UPI0036855AB6
MQNSYRDQLTIANVLAAYIRTHATKPPASQNIPAGEPPAKGQGIPADVHAALTVLTIVETDPRHRLPPAARTSAPPGSPKPNSPQRDTRLTWQVRT